ncbi:hypothetical protein [Paraflavitalea speifideaquila]|uniref:hypothetical protein n=1 Tax=Paraflavitalea speifideaquila TaxID=3076558 RepID=UPI0028E2B9EB|nr:hypothetical protein [Paraflavitalea speifideiaquila]
MRNLELNASIDNTGKLTVHNRKRLDQYCLDNKGKEIKVKFERKAKTRSLPQNNYYWGVVVVEVRLGLLNIGYDMTTEEVHEFLKGNFNKQQLVNSDGVVMEFGGSTTEMTTVQMMEYVDKIAQWAAEYLSITIPLPDQELKFNY